MTIKKLVLASHNKGKIKEISELLSPYKIEVVSAVDLNLPDVEETGTTFEENSRLKAVELAKLSGEFCLADDSGLCVDVLGGRPGVYSARYAPNRDFDKGIDKLLNEIKVTGSDNYNAHFSCVIALAHPHTLECQIFEGRVDGHLSKEKRGVNGFGYDPIFIPDEGDGRTFAEMSNDEKSKISHRGRALAKFIRSLQEWNK